MGPHDEHPVDDASQGMVLAQLLRGSRGERGSSGQEEGDRPEREEEEGERPERPENEEYPEEDSEGYSLDEDGRRLSCCGDVLDEDYMICPTCKEHN